MMRLGRVFTFCILHSAFCISSASAQDKITYQDHVLPVFRNACLNCHNPDKKRADLDLSSYAGAMAGGGSGKAVEPGDPDGSLLYRLVTHAEEPVMPPKGDKLSDKDLELVKRWIVGGVLENSGSTAAAAAKPKADLKIDAGAGKPEGPPAMPGDELLLDPPVHTSRPGAVLALASSPWAPLVAVGGQKQVLLYNPQTRDLLGVLPFPEGFPNVLKFSRNGKLLLVAGGVGAKAGKAVVFDVAGGNRVTEVGDELDAVLAADVSPDQSLVALGGPGKVVKIYATATGALVGRIKKHTDWINAVAFSPDGVLLATGDRNGGLIVWEADSANELYVLPGHKASVTDVAFRGDSDALASSSEDGDVKLWSMADGKQAKSWSAHKEGVTSVDFAPDGRLVTAGRDKRLKTWKPDGAALKAYDPFDDVALHAVFDNSDGGKLAVGADWTGAIRVFNMDDAKPLGTLDANPPTVAARLESANAKLPELQSAADKLATEAAAARVRADEAASEKRAAESVIPGLSKAVDDAKAAAAEAMKAREEAATALDALQSAARAKRAERDQLVQTSLGAMAAKDMAAAETDAAAQDVSTKQAAASAAVARAAEAASAAEIAPGDGERARVAAGARAEAEAAVDRLAAAQRAFGAKSDELSTMMTTVDRAFARADAATDAASDAQRAADDARKSVDHANADVDVSKKDLAGAEAAKAEAAAAILKAAEQMARVAASVDELKPGVDKAAAELAGAKSRVARLRAGQFFTQVYAARQAVLALQAEADAATAAAQAEQAAAEKAVADVPAFEKRMAEFDKSVAAAEQAVPIAKQTATAAANVLKGLEKIAADREAFAKQSAEHAGRVAALSTPDPANKLLADAAAAAKQSADLLAAELDKVKAGLKSQQQSARATEQAHAAAVAHLGKERAARQDAPKTLEVLRAAIPVAQAMAVEKKATADAATRELADAQRNAEHLGAQYAELKKQLAL